MGYDILIVDDFNVSNEIVKEGLGSVGFKAYTCLNANDALKLMQEIKFDVIITDYYMPEVNGIDFLIKIRKIVNYETTPVIFLSSASDPKVKETVQSYDYTIWINKPFNLDKLALAVKNVLK